MNSKVMIQRFAFVFVIFANAMVSCNVNTFETSGNSTQTGNGTILTLIGLLYGPDGITPAPDARVTIHQLDTGSQTNLGYTIKKSNSGMETAFTDHQGKFVFSSLRSRGPYMIEADQGESLFVLIEYIAFNRNDSIKNVEGTLKLPGSMKAVICFNYSDFRVEKASFQLNASYKSDFANKSLSDFYFSRSYNAQWIDSANDCNGVLSFDKLPEGAYTFTATIRFANDNKKSIYLKKPGIIITSDQCTDLDTFRFPEMDVPDVEKCWAHYDSKTGAISLCWSWNTSDTAQISGVNIYQQSISKNLLKVNNVPVRDTFFTDTGFWDFPRRPEIQTYWLDSAFREKSLSELMATATNDIYDTIPHGRFNIPIQAIRPAYFLMSVDKNGKESWKVHSVSPSQIWWKMDDGIPFLPDTLPIAWPNIF